ncbi:TPA: hypothetical protein NM870_003770 [Acinetobacter baumannii]|nr:hypothetical protein [Acinetobacter baumannii]
MNEKEYIYDYYLTIVKPTVNEFLKDKADLRKGRLAAIVLDHVRDYRAVQIGLNNKNGEASPNKVLDQMKEVCPDAVFIRDACNASKHGILTNNPKDIPRTLSKADQIRAEKNEGMFAAPFGQAMFGESNYVFIKFDKVQDFKGKQISYRDLHASINEVIQYWDKELDITN